MIVLAILAVTVVGIAIYKYVGTSGSQKEMMKNTEDITTNYPENTEIDEMIVKDQGDDAMEKSEGDDAKMMANSKYIVYSKDSLASAPKAKRVLYFYANWCPSCKVADADFTENISKIPEDVSVIRVNYNDSDTDQEERELAKKYAITYQHTFVQIDSAGKEITKWNGGQIEELISNVK